jgi:hypothetical protein
LRSWPETSAIKLQSSQAWITGMATGVSSGFSRKDWGDYAANVEGAQ